VVRQAIDELRQRGVAVLLTTHDLEEVERLADEVVIIDGGRLLAQGSPAELTSAGGGEGLRFGAPPGLDLAELGARVGAVVVEDGPGRYRVEGEATATTVAAVAAWLAERDLPVHDLSLGRRRLEDVFLRLVAEAADGDRHGDGRAQA
jgi:ABC-2 type transport system ATP-binding protein